MRIIVRSALGNRAESFAVSPPYDPLTDNWRQPLVDWIHSLPKPVAFHCPTDFVGCQLADICRIEGIAVPGLDPATPTSSASLPQIALNGEALMTTYTVPDGVTGVTYGAESSENLVTWSAVANSAAGSTKTFSSGTAGKERLFLRHRLTFSP